MEICNEALSGLQILGDESQIGNQQLKGLLKDVLSSILTKSKLNVQESTKSCDAGAWKQVFAALVILFLEAAKNDLDLENLQSFLEDQNVSSNSLKSILNSYSEEKENLRQHLSRFAVYPQHIVDADWRLQQSVKSSDLGRIGKPQFLLSLKTEGSMKTEDIQFSCSLDQMQDLVFKLKDACKCLERNSQNS